MDAYVVTAAPGADHAAAIGRLLADLDTDRVGVVGHRVVHGGERFSAPVVIDGDVAAAIEAGMCFVNSQNVRDLRQPFGGTKASGTGREGGTWSYEVFCEPKNVAVSMGSHHIPHWGV